MLLALAAGLRRGEIDSLSWPQIDFERALIRVEATESSGLKTADSRGEVAIERFYRKDHCLAGGGVRCPYWPSRLILMARIYLGLLSIRASETQSCSETQKNEK